MSAVPSRVQARGAIALAFVAMTAPSTAPSRTSSESGHTPRRRRDRIPRRRGSRRSRQVVGRRLSLGHERAVTAQAVAWDDDRNLIVVSRCCSSPTIRKSAAPPGSNATACTTNEPRPRCPGCCSARPLSDTWVTSVRACDDVDHQHDQIARLALLVNAYCGHAGVTNASRRHRHSPPGRHRLLRAAACTAAGRGLHVRRACVWRPMRVPDRRPLGTRSGVKAVLS